MTGFGCILRRTGALLWPLGCAVSLAAMAPRPSWGLDPGRMQRDLRVMEDILTSLCRHHGAAQPWLAPACRGVHVEGYGAVFVVENCPEEASIGPPPGAAAPPAATPELAGRPALVLEFVSQHAGGLSQLEENERIAVICQPASGVPAAPARVPVCPALAGPDGLSPPAAIAWPAAGEPSGVTGADIAVALWRLLRAPTPGDPIASRPADRAASAHGAPPAPQGCAGAGEPKLATAAAAGADHQPGGLLSASVTRKDLDEFRRGRLDATQLRQRVRFAEQDPADSVYRSVDIMAGILERGLARPGQGALRAAVTGAYQPGLGALFCVTVPAPASAVDWTRLEAHSSGTDAHRDGTDAGGNATGAGGVLTNWTQSLPAAVVESELVDLLVRYGPTLAGLQDDEQVVVEVQLPAAPGSGAAGGPPPLACRVVARVDWRGLAGLTGDRAAAAALRKAVTVKRY